MHAAEIGVLFDYNYWANARILRAASALDQTGFTAPAELSHGSVRGTLAHLLAAETIWRRRCQEGVSPSTMLGEEDVPTLEALQSRWADEERRMRAWLASLDDRALAAPVPYKNTKGVPFEGILWQILVHVVNHGTQTRSEAAVALTRFGHSPGDLDLLLFLRQAGSAAAAASAAAKPPGSSA